VFDDELVTLKQGSTYFKDSIDLKCHLLDFSVDTTGLHKEHFMINGSQLYFKDFNDYNNHILKNDSVCLLDSTFEKDGFVVLKNKEYVFEEEKVEEVKKDNLVLEEKYTSTEFKKTKEKFKSRAMLYTSAIVGNGIFSDDGIICGITTPYFISLMIVKTGGYVEWYEGLSLTFTTPNKKILWYADLCVGGDLYDFKYVKNYFGAGLVYLFNERTGIKIGTNCSVMYDSNGITLLDKKISIGIGIHYTIEN
jgi:hypothetical protein